MKGKERKLTGKLPDSMIMKIYIDFISCTEKDALFLLSNFTVFFFGSKF